VEGVRCLSVVRVDVCAEELDVFVEKADAGIVDVDDRGGVEASVRFDRIVVVPVSIEVEGRLEVSAGAGVGA
jgi:hypothetical protein